MQESAQIAYTLARRTLRELPGQGGNSFLDTVPLHMHVPEGATPKDGPSAGVTMTTALLSAALDRCVAPCADPRVRPAPSPTHPPCSAVRKDCAMTGEVDLMGTVMPVGGIREKCMAARRAGVACLIFPAANKRDFDELPDHLREGLEVHFARTYAEVFSVAFPAQASVVAGNA
jgi:Lon-like ATP-dependent protease